MSLKIIHSRLKEHLLATFALTCSWIDSIPITVAHVVFRLILFQQYLVLSVNSYDTVTSGNQYH